MTSVAHQTDTLKEIVYEMRLDEVSARYGEFGPFYINLRLAPDSLVGTFAPLGEPRLEDRSAPDWWRSSERMCFEALRVEKLILDAERLRSLNHS